MTRFLYLILAIYLLCNSSLLANDRFIDTLLLRLDQDISDSLAYETYFDLAESYYFYYEDSLDKANYYNEQLLELAVTNKELRWQVSHYNLKARIFQYQKEFEQALVYFDRGIEIAQIKKDDLRAAQLMDNKAGVFSSMRRFDEALALQHHAMDVFKAENDSASIGVCYFGLGFSYTEKKEYKTAIQHFYSSLKYFWKNDGAQAELYGNLAINYRELNELDSAMLNFRKAADLSAEFPIVSAKNKYELALLHYDQGALNEAKNLMKDILSDPKIPKDAVDVSYFQLLLASIHLDEGNINKARQIKDKIGPRLESSEVMVYKKDYYKFSSRFLEETGRYKESLAFLKLFQTAKDSIEKVEVATNAKDIEIKYETEIKESQITLLNLEKESAMTQLASTRRVTILSLLGVGILGFLMFRMTQLNGKLKKSSDEKDILLREIHHRVKNNLQVISALLTLQSGYIKDENAVKALKEGQDRVESMALIHRKLYQQDNLKGVNTRDYFEQLCNKLLESYSLTEEGIDLHMDIDEIWLDVDTMIPMGLMVNELFSNNLKHGIPKNRKPKIEFSFKEINGGLNLKIKDNGEGINKIEQQSNNTFGHSLIQSFARKLNADLTYNNDNGLEVNLLIKKFIKAA